MNQALVLVILMHKKKILKSRTFFFSGLFLLFELTFTGNAQNTRFALEWDGNIVVFTTVSGLDLTLQESESTVATRSNPLQTIKTAGMKSISLKGGICRTDNILYKWFCTYNLSVKQKRDITVKLLNANGDPVKVWKVRQASPLKVEGPTLNAKGNDVAVETVVLAYERIELE